MGHRIRALPRGPAESGLAHRHRVVDEAQPRGPRTVRRPGRRSRCRRPHRGPGHAHDAVHGGFHPRGHPYDRRPFPRRRAAPGSTTVTVIVETDPRVRAATRAVYVAFIGCGFAMARWATRIPPARDGLGLSPSQLGLVLLAIATGSIVSLVLAGQIVHRFGSRLTVTAMAVLLGVAMGAVAVGYQFGVLPVVLGLFLFGFANGAWDVAMNVQGAVVEGRLGGGILPRFPARYSVGTVAGALIGAGAVALHVPVTAHIIAAGLLVAAAVILSVRTFVPDISGSD